MIGIWRIHVFLLNASIDTFDTLHFGASLADILGVGTGSVNVLYVKPASVEVVVSIRAENVDTLVTARALAKHGYFIVLVNETSTKTAEGDGISVGWIVLIVISVLLVFVIFGGLIIWKQLKRTIKVSCHLTREHTLVLPCASQMLCM